MFLIVGAFNKGKAIVGASPATDKLYEGSLTALLGSGCLMSYLHIEASFSSGKPSDRPSDS